MKKLIVLVLVALFAVTAKAAVGSTVYLPQVYDSSAEPTATPTATRTPSPTRTPVPTATGVPGTEWMWIIRGKNIGDEAKVYAIVPGIGYEIKGVKIAKTLHLTAYCPSGVDCTLEPIPDTWPPECQWPPGDLTWCQVEKIIWDSNAKRACSTQYPFSCVEIPK